jgi:hypothetical protein
LSPPVHEVPLSPPIRDWVFVLFLLTALHARGAQAQEVEVDSWVLVGAFEGFTSTGAYLQTATDLSSEGPYFVETRLFRAGGAEEPVVETASFAVERTGPNQLVLTHIEAGVTLAVRLLTPDGFRLTLADGSTAVMTRLSYWSAALHPPLGSETPGPSQRRFDDLLGRVQRLEGFWRAESPTEGMPAGTTLELDASDDATILLLIRHGEAESEEVVLVIAGVTEERVAVVELDDPERQTFFTWRDDGALEMTGARGDAHLVRVPEGE